MSVKIAITGATGRMGRMLIEAVTQSADSVLTVALARPGNPAIGQDAAAFLGKSSGVLISDDINQLANADVLIDFTKPDGVLKHLGVCRASGTRVIVGATGFDDAGKAAIADAAKDIGIVYAQNMSVGVNLVFKLLDVAAKVLATGYDIEIVEMHHRMKVDAPSGTALRMGEVVAGALGRDLKDVAVYDREGITGERDPSSIGFATLRGGDVVGDHTVVFAGMGERVEVTHKASSRMIYASGSLRAARFLMQQSSGLFDMQDVLGLK
ncbi:4-hydroxy-tetrahydrodipicolinate reductase [Amantichitinum ursilacus]|uniref:4-hydroxy-tetrahydrodipicolinate reductase n=1 Tax=Amantichitinum ursilacus TaxID=857265 RepID=A0A0N0XL89_9NEIS|nr:4-hydroxy-tetrahydrodipicolinate reductase [Amantichitinum ursilacus]KPC53494.1 4-hydroxy-tetrahydrodipicolinate reductase [Amantichitinum ursilacus]